MSIEPCFPLAAASLRGLTHYYLWGVLIPGQIYRLAFRIQKYDFHPRKSLSNFASRSFTSRKLLVISVLGRIVRSKVYEQILATCAATRVVAKFARKNDEHF